VAFLAFGFTGLGTRKAGGMKNRPNIVPGEQMANFVLASTGQNTVNTVMEEPFVPPQRGENK
jgi:hypothetical protein